MPETPSLKNKQKIEKNEHFQKRSKRLSKRTLKNTDDKGSIWGMFLPFSETFLKNGRIG